MQLSADMRKCLVACDTAGIRALWSKISPHLPQPASDADALIAIHHARTLAQSIPPKLRFYSHRWLLDHGYPSGLPDRLKPAAERIYPRIVSAVGISVSFRDPLLRPLGDLVRRAMEDAVLEAHADGRMEPEFVKSRMREARNTAIRKLVG